MPDIKVVFGFLLAFGIGVLCRVAGLPLPAPPVIIGALLVVAMTAGYILTGRFFPHREKTQERNCAGPVGQMGQREQAGQGDLS